MEEICFDNNVASIKGYLVTDLQRGVPYAIKVMVTGVMVWGGGPHLPPPWLHIYVVIAALIVP